MQHRQYQTVIRQLQAIFNFSCPAFSGGTIWVTNSVGLRPFYVLS